MPQGLPRRRGLRDAAQEIITEGEDHPHRTQRVVGGLADGFHERSPHRFVRHERVDLFELIHEKQHSRAASFSETVEHGREHRGRSLELLVDRLWFRGQIPHRLGDVEGNVRSELLLECIRLLQRIRLLQSVGLLHGLRHASRLASDETAGESFEWARTGAHLQDDPTSLLAQPRDDSRLDEGALARSRRADHGEHRLVPHPLEKGRDLGVAAKEEIGVMLRKGQQSAKGALCVGQPYSIPRDQLAERLGHLIGRGPLLRLFVHATSDEVADLGWNALGGILQECGLGGADIDTQRLQSRRDERGMTGEELVEDHAQSPKVCRLCAGPLPPLFRRHVHGRAHDDVGIRFESALAQRFAVAEVGPLGRHFLKRRALVGRGERFGQTEIQHPQPAVQRPVDVFRLEVPMEQLVSMRLDERLGDRQPNAETLARREVLLVGSAAQGLPLEVFEGEVWRPVVLADGVDRHDVRVVEASRDSRLEHEAIEGLLVHQGGGADELERDLPAELDVTGEVDVAHPASTEEADDSEAVHVGSWLEEHLLSTWFVALGVLHDNFGRSSLRPGAPSVALRLEGGNSDVCQRVLTASFGRTCPRTSQRSSTASGSVPKAAIWTRILDLEGRLTP